MSGVEDMVRRAEMSLGVGEPNYMQKWYADIAYSSNWAWCNIAISYWAKFSGNFDAVCFGTKYAYTVYHAQRFQQQGRWHADVAGIRRGDIVFFDWGLTNQIGAIDHIGLVTGVSNGAVYTIEGNTSNRCARRVRYASTIAGYGRPAYDSAPLPPATSTYVTYPGEEWFKSAPYSPIITAMGKRLVTEGCSDYQVGPGPQWTDADRRSYAKWQEKLGLLPASGWPGKASWDKLKVPRS